MSSAVTATPRSSPSSRRPLEHDLLLAALPHPIIVLAPDNRIVYANAAAEAFLSSGIALLKRARLDEVVAFGCPLLALVEQVRNSGVTLNEYSVEVAGPKFQSPKLVDVYGGLMTDNPDLVVLMLQQRNMAQMIERQLTHRAAARSVSGLAAVLAHEIKNPLSGIRGAAQLLEQGLGDEDRSLTQLICSETDRIRNLVDRMEVFGDERPLVTEPVNIHDVLDHVRRLCESGFGRGIRFIEDYDPSLPPVPGNRDKLVQAILNLVKNAVEAIGDNKSQGRIIMQTSFRPGV
ncbi:MAG TPA: histidine kinase dimerization/phospho-acceptor domain-containing protein, partial [Hyphomicrobium sp.]|nr:histidine kinase dimerization/phospho-acceptor domain-containing protein [Hyphomicrobium sp.]